MRNVLLACALALGTSVGCSSSYIPGEYASVGYRAPAPATAAAPARGRVRTASARRRTAPTSASRPVEAARPATLQAGAGPS